MEPLRKFFAIVAGIIRELSGEAAYARHLKFHGMTHSPEEWRRFSDKLWNAQATRSRCC